MMRIANEPRELGLLSVVAPIYNEEALIDEFYARVCTALDGLQFELVLVDDGSTDGSSAGARAPGQHRPAGARRVSCRATSATRRR